MHGDFTLTTNPEQTLSTQNPQSACLGGEGQEALALLLAAFLGSGLRLLPLPALRLLVVQLLGPVLCRRKPTGAVR